MPTTALGAGGRWSPGLGWGCRFGPPDVHHQRPRGGSARAQRGWHADPDLSRCWMLPTRLGWILLMRKQFERSEQALGAIPGPSSSHVGLCGA
jgi:hypothetical protein